MTNTQTDQTILNEIFIKPSEKKAAAQDSQAGCSGICSSGACKPFLG